MVKILFAGATGVVQGSHYIVSDDNNHYAVDMGGVQSRSSELEHKIKSIYPLAHSIRAVILSHSHHDHQGKLPRFIQEFGYRGPIFSTEPTHSIWTRVMNRNKLNGLAHKYNRICRNILDGRIGEAERGFLEITPAREDEYDRAMHLGKDGRVQTIKYWSQLVHPSIERLGELTINKKFYQRTRLDDNLEFELLKSSHIIGSSQILLDHSNGSKKRILFTGDIGSQNSFFSEPDTPDSIDALIFDSTNGDVVFDQDYDPKQELKKIINDTINRGGQTYIKTFTNTRMQIVINMVKELYKSHEIPQNIRYFIDTPGGSRIIKVFHDHLDYLDNFNPGLDPTPFIIKNKDRIGNNCRRSRKLMKTSEPKVVIGAPGMVGAGEGRLTRYLTQIKRRGQSRYGINLGIEDPRNSIVLCGYQALKEGQHLRSLVGSSRPSRIVLPTEGEPKEYYVNAQVHEIRQLSGHMDQENAVDYIGRINPKRVFLVHAEDEKRQALKNCLIKRLDMKPEQIVLPNLYDIYDI